MAGVCVKDVLAELGAHPQGTFLDLLAFNDAVVGACDITGVSPVWEMHPDTDELFYVIEGTLEFTLLRGREPERVVVPAGSACVVPRGVWHRPAAPGGARFLYMTPGATVHSEADDPRRAPE